MQNMKQAHSQLVEAPGLDAGVSELCVGHKARASVNMVSWYDAATNQAGEGLWRKPEEVAAHVERIRADFPEAEISVNGKRVPDGGAPLLGDDEQSDVLMGQSQ